MKTIYGDDHRGDTLVVSLHGDPEQEYPYYQVYADGTGTPYRPEGRKDKGNAEART